MIPKRSRRRTWIGILVVVAIVVVGAGIKFGRYHVIARRFDVVEPGRIYRGGKQEAGPLKRLIQENGIRTIVTMMDDEPEDRHEQLESELVQEFRIERVRVPMPGDGRGTFDALDEAADKIADPENQPVYVHCSAGVNRTGAAIAAFRMKYEGWTYDRAMTELSDHWVSKEDKPELYDHLRAYYDERVAKESSATDPKSHEP